MSTITPPLDPLAHRAAIDAMEAQRAAYRRYARMVESQHQSLSDADADKAVAFADEATRGFEALEHGARRLAPLVQRARSAGSPDEQAALMRTLDDLAREARQAEQAIRNLSSQLEAWRDATGRQLAELGIVPGGSGGDAGDVDAGGAPRSPAGYGPGAHPVHPGATQSFLLDTKG